MDSEPIIHANNETFNEEVLESELPVLVDFWAPWCGPCHTVAPIIEELAKAYEGRVKVVKVNVDDAREVASDIGIMNIPTIVLFDGGKAVTRQIGVQPKTTLEQMVKEVLKHHD